MALESSNMRKGRSWASLNALIPAVLLFSSAAASASQATFESLAEANANSPARVTIARADAPSVGAHDFGLGYGPGLPAGVNPDFLPNSRVPFKLRGLETHTTQRPGMTGAVVKWRSHPALDDYPPGTTFVYRSADRYERSNRWKLNAVYLVFSSAHYNDKEAALAFLNSTGLIRLIGEQKGSVILITPVREHWGDVDQEAFLKLQRALNDGTFGFATLQDFGGLLYTYAFATDPNASTFFNDFIAPVPDSAGRIAGLFAVGGENTRPSHDHTLRFYSPPTLSVYLPAYLIDPSPSAMKEYLDGNDLSEIKPVAHSGTKIWIDDARSALEVIEASGNGKTLAEEIADAYVQLLSHRMRVPLSVQRTYTFDQSPYYLSLRDPFDVNGRTPDGIQLIWHRDDPALSKAPMDPPSPGDHDKLIPTTTWAEYVPVEFLKTKSGDKAAHTVPVIIAIHGGGGDERSYAEQMNWPLVAGRNRIIVVSPYEVGQIVALTDYILKTYPAADPSRIYITGYSLGGERTEQLALLAPLRFAAIAPESAADELTPPGASEVEPFSVTYPFDEMVKDYGRYLWPRSNGKELPTLFMTENLDPHVENGRKLIPSVTAFIDAMRPVNGFSLLKESEFDFNRYAFWGFPTVNNRLTVAPYDSTFLYRSDLANAKGIPLIRLALTTAQTHAYNPLHAEVIWEFVRHYRRDPITKEIVYLP
jgi:pimeloyl-ACP methyl ester carboxylesterase